MVSLQIINKVLKSKDPTIIINNDLIADHFIGYEAYYDFIMEHYRRYGNVPDISTFVDAFEDFVVIDVHESDTYLVDKLYEEYLYAQMVPIIQKTANLLVKSNSLDALEYLKSEVSALTPRCSSYGVDIIANANERYEEYKSKRDGEREWCRPTGFKELDDVIGGLSIGEELCVIVARTNQGKSWVLAEMATHNWKVGANVGYVSPEMSANRIGYRFDTLNEHFSNSDLYRGVDVEMYKDYIDCLMDAPKHKFIVATPMDFNKKITVSKLRNFCIQCNLDMLCIDGIKYVTDERGKRGDNTSIALTNVSEDLMALSLELKIPIAVVVQSNRGGVVEEGTPELENIKDSDGIAHNASTVISIRQKNNKLLMTVKKNRNGAVGVELAYDWDINKGLFEFNPTEGQYCETEEPRSRRYEQSSETPVNKQPLRASASNDVMRF